MICGMVILVRDCGGVGGGGVVDASLLEIIVLTTLYSPVCDP